MFNRVSDWFRYSLMPSIPAIAGVSLLLAFGWVLTFELPERVESRPKHPVKAEITGLSFGISKRDSFQIYIEARDQEGHEGHAAVNARDIEGCRVGDPIQAQSDGLTLILSPAPCQPQ